MRRRGGFGDLDGALHGGPLGDTGVLAEAAEFATLLVNGVIHHAVIQRLEPGQELGSADVGPIELFEQPLCLVLLLQPVHDDLLPTTEVGRATVHDLLLRRLVDREQVRSSPTPAARACNVTTSEAGNQLPANMVGPHLGAP